jgi:hypothetical protein
VSARLGKNVTMDNHALHARMTRSRSAIVIALVGALLAIGVRWYFIAHAQVYQPLDTNGDSFDAAEYYRYAWHLVHHHLFSQSSLASVSPVADSYRDPGYPMFLAIFMAMTSSYDQWYAWVLLAHACLGGLTVYCLVLALRDALPSWMLALVALGTALWPHSVSMTAYVLTENLSAPLLTVALLCLREAVARESRGYAVAAGLALSVASLTNAVLAPMVLPLALVLAWRKIMPTRLVLVLVVATLVPVVAWGIRNAMVATGQSSSFRAEINLVQGSWPTYHVATQLAVRHIPEGVQTTQAIEDEIHLLHADRLAGLRHMQQRMSQSPGTYVAWYLGKPALLWGWQIGLGAGDIYVYPTRYSPYITTPAWRVMEAIAFALNGAVGLLALAGLAMTALKRKPEAVSLALAVTVAWVTVVYGVLQSDPRYSIPFRGAEFALAGIAVVALGTLPRRLQRIGEPAHKSS